MQSNSLELNLAIQAERNLKLSLTRFYLKTEQSKDISDTQENFIVSWIERIPK